MTEKPTYEVLEKKIQKLEQAELGDKQTEDALRESKSPIREKIEDILEPKGGTGTLSLGDIIDSEVLQSMMDDYYRLTNIGGAVLDISGNVLVAIGWQDICTKFHRCHPDTLKNCIESDTILSSGVPAGEFKAYRCKNNLWDMVTPIEAGGRHIGNIFLGQFFYEDEMPDYDLFRSQARQYGFDEKQYLAALDNVPRLSRETADTAMTFYAKLAGMISSLSYSTISLSHALSQQEMVLHKLSDSEKKFRSLFESINDSLFVHLLTEDNLPGHFIEVNDMACKKLGYSRQELLQLTPRDISAPDDGMNPVEIGNKLLAHGSTLFETMHLTKEGQLIPVESHIRLFDYDGQQAVLSIARDITERKLTEKTLRESKAFLDNLNDIAYMADAQGNVTRVNAAIEKITGFAPEEVIGKPFLPLFIEKDHVSLIDVYKRTLGGESLENYLTFTSGKICHFTSLPHRNIDGDIIGTFGIARDITESRRTEEALKESEYRLRKAQQVAMIGNWEYDIPTGKVWGSEEAFRIYGIERKTPLLPIDEVESCIIEAKRVNQSLMDLINKKVAYDIEFEINPVNREEVTVIHSIAELACDESGNPMKVLGIMQDITESKAKEKDRHKLRAQLQQAQKMESVGRLAGGVAHDFNNMLGVILGHTEMIMDQMDSSHLFFSNLQEINNAAMRSADLTRQLLAFARKQTVSPKVLDLNKTVDGLLTMLQRLIGEDIDLAWLPGKKLWPVNIDPSQIDQIMANLCVNARDAIAGVGKLTIETGICTFDESYCGVHQGFIPGEYVFLAVSDNGSGMDAETQAKIFEPFFTTKPMDKGTGLGLSTVYGIVKQNNGFINVYSEPYQGTTFKIYLSRHTGNAGQIQQKIPKEPVSHGNETILLVEDEPAILNLTTMMLQRLGYIVLEASTPGEAISFAREHMGKIDLLMSDVVMPEMNGRDLAKTLLSLNPSLKRLFMSGYTANVIAHHGVLDEGVHFIQKPFSKKDLADIVKKVLEE